MISLLAYNMGIICATHGMPRQIELGYSGGGIIISRCAPGLWVMGKLSKRQLDVF